MGGMARYGLSLWGARCFGRMFPWSTLFINTIGSSAVGALFALMDADLVPPAAQAAHRLVTFGFFGGFTTFSTFSLEVLKLARSGQRLRAGLYVAATLSLGMAAVSVGYLLASARNL